MLASGLALLMLLMLSGDIESNPGPPRRQANRTPAPSEKAQPPAPESGQGYIENKVLYLP